MKRISSLTFDYCSTRDIQRFGDLLSSREDVPVEEISSNYMLLMPDNNPTHHDCPVTSLLLDDVKRCQDPKIEKCYQQLVDTYSQQVVDQFILPESGQLVHKIINAIEFTMDIYGESEIAVMVFTGSKINKTYPSSIPLLIYHAIQLEYHIMSQEYENKTYTNAIYVIKRRMVQ